MGIRVGEIIASAAVSREKLRVGVVVADPVVSAALTFARSQTSAVEPIATVSYVLAAADVAFVDLKLGVVVDTNGFYKLFGDTFGAVDAARLRVSKAFADGNSTSDDSVFAFTKARADTVEPSDVFARVVEFNRLFEDEVEQAEAQAFSVDKPLSDTFTTPHFEVFDHQKLLVDGVAMNDGMEAVDGFGIALTRGVSNVTLVADAKALRFATSRVESITTQDAGSLRSQGYCDFSYFAEDYVGASLAF